MHILALTPKMLHIFGKVRESNTDRVHKTSADSTALGIAGLLCQCSNLHFCYIVDSVILSVSLQTSFHPVQRMVQKHPVWNRHFKLHLQRCLFFGRYISMHADQQGLELDSPRPLYQYPQSACYSCCYHSSDRCVHRGSSYATHLGSSRECWVQDSRLRYLSAGQSVSTCFSNIQQRSTADPSNSVCIINVIKIHYFTTIPTGDVTC